jgi:hypothetical protein
MGISMSNDFSKKMINTLIPKQLLDLNPIIAGGFPLSLFMTETLYKESPLMMSVAMENLDTSWAYSDIDLFFTKEDFEKTKAIFSIFEYMVDTSKVSKHNIGFCDPITGHEKIIKIETLCDGTNLNIIDIYKNSKCFNLIEKLFSWTILTTGVVEHDVIEQIKNIYGNNFCLFLHHKNAIIFSDRENVVSIISLSKNTQWAYTLAFSSKDFNIPCGKSISSGKIIQIIKKSYDSVDELLNSFDMKLCSIGWKDGRFIFGKNFNDQLQTNQLGFNNIEQIKSLTFASRLFQYTRILKYCRKTGMRPDKQMFDYMVSVIIDSLYVEEKLSSIRNDPKNNQNTGANSFGTLLGNKLIQPLFNSVNPQKPDSEAQTKNKIKVKLLSSLKDYEETVVTNSGPLDSMMATCIQSLELLVQMEHWNDMHKISLFPYAKSYKVERFIK